MFLKLESKIQKNLLFSLATISFLFFGPNTHAMEQEENIFSEFLDVKIQNPNIPDTVDYKALNKILGVSIRAGNIKERPLRLNLLVALLSLQADLCNAVSKENSTYNEWQNATEACKKFLEQINPADAIRYPLAINLDDGGQLIGTLDLKSPEALSIFLILQSTYTLGGQVRIDYFDKKPMDVIKSSVNNDISNLGTAFLLYKDTNDFYRIFSHFQDKKISLIAKENILTKYPKLKTGPFGSRIHPSYYSSLENIFNLTQRYVDLIDQQSRDGILTDRLTEQDKQYSKARDHLCKQYLKIKPGLERLYQAAREKLDSSEKILGKTVSIIGFERPETIEEPIDINTLLIEGKPEQTRKLGEEGLAELVDRLESINAQYQPTELEVSQEVVQPVQDKEKPKKKRKKRRKKKKKTPEKTEKELREELKAINELAILDTVKGMVEAVEEGFKKEEAEKTKTPQPQTPDATKKKKRKRKKKKKHLQEAFKRKEKVSEKTNRERPENKTKKIEKQERKKKAKESKEQAPEPKKLGAKIVYEPARDRSVVAYKTPTYISINDQKNKNTIINLYKISQEKINPFEFEYDVRVDGWFSNPNDQLSIEITHHSQNYSSEEYYNEHPDKKARIVAIHSFAKAVDPYIFECGFKTVQQTPRGEILNIVVPGELLMEESHTEYGYFIYGFYTNENGEQVCYHRTFTKVAPNDFLASTSAKGRAAVTAEILGEFSD